MRGKRQPAKARNVTGCQANCGVATAVAGFRKIGTGMVEHKEYVHPSETIYSHDPTGIISLSVALGASSNNYFIRALNTLDLYEELRDIYWACGISFNNRRPYSLYPSDSHTDYNSFKSDLSQLAAIQLEVGKQVARRLLFKSA